MSYDVIMYHTNIHPSLIVGELISSRPAFNREMWFVFVHTHLMSHVTWTGDDTESEGVLMGNVSTLILSTAAWRERGRGALRRRWKRRKENPYIVK